MQHSFDIDIAKEYGLLEAILLNNLWLWIEKNKANNQCLFDDKYWVCNSTKAYNELFPYVSQRQIQNALLKLRNLGILITENYNNSAYNRTLWYAFTFKGERIMQKCKMHYAKKGNALCKNVKCKYKYIINKYIDINSINNINKLNIVKSNNTILSINSKKEEIKEYKEKKEEKEKQDFEVIFDLWNSKNIIHHQNISDSLLRILKAKIKEYGCGQIQEAIEHYSVILKDTNFFFSYKWTLEDFLSRRKVLKSFLTDGEKWINYQQFLKAPKTSNGKTTKAVPSWYDSYLSKANEKLNEPKVQENDENLDAFFKGETK